MAKDLYPNEFFFAIPDNSESINQLVKKCLNNDSDINNSYSNLKKKLRGDLDLSVRNIIPDTIESLLI